MVVLFVELDKDHIVHNFYFSCSVFSLKILRFYSIYFYNRQLLDNLWLRIWWKLSTSNLLLEFYHCMLLFLWGIGLMDQQHQPICSIVSLVQFGLRQWQILLPSCKRLLLCMYVTLSLDFLAYDHLSVNGC